MCRSLIRNLDVNINLDLEETSLEEVPDEAIRYGVLSQKKEPSDKEEEELIQILEKSVKDELLFFWIEQIDHIIAHAQGDLDDDARKSYRDQASVLREHLDINTCNTQIYYKSIETKVQSQHEPGRSKESKNGQESKANQAC
jgi:hypothetical protein